MRDRYDGGMPRFVVLLHETPPGYVRGTHFDLMLESSGVLHTWAMEKLPSAAESVLAEQLPDHRLHYLDFEGSVEGGRGSVRRVDVGEYALVESAGSAMKLLMRGKLLLGVLTLAAEGEGDQRWRVELSPG